MERCESAQLQTLDATCTNQVSTGTDTQGIRDIQRIVMEDATEARGHGIISSEGKDVLLHDDENQER